MFASNAWANGSKEAGRYLETRFERTRFRAMGGADIAVDTSTPANGALGGGLKLTVLGVDAYSTLSEGIRATRLGYDMWDTAFQAQLQNEDDLRTLGDQVLALSERIRGESFDIELHTRVELLNFLVNKGPWTMQFGGYSEGLGGVRYVTPPRIQLVNAGEDDVYLDFGRSTTVLRAGARIDNGAFFSLGYAVPLASSMRLAVGGRVRGFYRVTLPEHVAGVSAHVRTIDDVSYPTELERRAGWGVAMDAYATLHFSEDITGFRVAAYVEDLVKYVRREDKDFFVPPRVGVGLAWTSKDGAFTVASDLEHVETLSPTWQSGISYTLGNESLGVTPMFGFIMNHRTITGSHMDPSVTAGLALNAGVLHVASVMELQTATRSFNAGLSVAIGFQRIESKRKEETNVRHDAAAAARVDTVPPASTAPSSTAQPQQPVAGTVPASTPTAYVAREPTPAALVAPEPTPVSVSQEPVAPMEEPIRIYVDDASE